MSVDGRPRFRNYARRQRTPNPDAPRPPLQRNVAILVGLGVFFIGLGLALFVYFGAI